jgi:hypothetical protein
MENKVNTATIDDNDCVQEEVKQNATIDLAKEIYERSEKISIEMQNQREKMCDKIYEVLGSRQAEKIIHNTGRLTLYIILKDHFLKKKYSDYTVEVDLREFSHVHSIFGSSQIGVPLILKHVALPFAKFLDLKLEDGSFAARIVDIVDCRQVCCLSSNGALSEVVSPIYEHSLEPEEGQKFKAHLLTNKLHEFEKLHLNEIPNNASEGITKLKHHLENSLKEKIALKLLENHVVFRIEVNRPPTFNRTLLDEENTVNYTLQCVNLNVISLSDFIQQTKALFKEINCNVFFWKGIKDEYGIKIKEEQRLKIVRPFKSESVHTVLKFTFSRYIKTSKH